MTELVHAHPARFVVGADEYAVHTDTAQHDQIWNVNDSSIENYSVDANFFGKPDGLLRILTRAAGRIGDVGLDVAGGSSGRAIGALMQLGIIQCGAVTNLSDTRSADTRAMHDRAGLTHISGNLLDARTWWDMEQWQQQVAPRGLAVIMHRPYGGLQNLMPSFYAGAVNWGLDRLRPGGVLFTQIPQILDGNLYSSDVPDFSNQLGKVCGTLYDRNDVSKVVPSEPLPDRNLIGKKQRTPYSYVAIIKKAA